jgi:transcriptional regulator with XRE-family HTH domain
MVLDSSSAHEESAVVRRPKIKIDKDTKLGPIIKQARERAGVTQAQVSTHMGHKTMEWLSMIENGLRSLDIEKIPALASYLGIHAKDLTFVALCQYYPNTAHALFPGQTIGDLRTCAEGSQQGPPLDDATATHVRDFTQLTEEHREMIQTMTAALARAQRSKVAIRRNRG